MPALSLSTKERMAWERISIKKILVFRGYELSPLNQKVLSQNIEYFISSGIILGWFLMTVFNLDY